jgi:hypothetical protein
MEETIFGLLQQFIHCFVADADAEGPYTALGVVVVVVVVVGLSWSSLQPSSPFAFPRRQVALEKNSDEKLLR